MDRGLAKSGGRVELTTTVLRDLPEDGHCGQAVAIRTKRDDPRDPTWAAIAVEGGAEIGRQMRDQDPKHPVVGDDQHRAADRDVPEHHSGPVGEDPSEHVRR